MATRAEELIPHRPPKMPDQNAARRLEAAESDEAIQAEWNIWRGAAESEGPFFSEHFQVQEQMGLMWKKQREFDPQQGRILRDDFNPVEFYDARNREENRRYLIEMLGNNDG